MPRTAGSADREPEQETTPWATWLKQARTARGKRPKDLVDAAEAIGEKLTPGQISNWESGRNPASPEAARLVAQLLQIDPVEALRAAGHEDWAEFAERQRDGAPKPPRDGDLEFIAKLRSSPDPEMHKLADQFEQDLERARRMARFEFEERQRQRGQASNDDGAVNTSVNKSA